LGAVLGYISYPTAEELATQEYHREELTGRAGIERALNAWLQGDRGLKIEEIDVTGEVISEHLLQEPTHGRHVDLSIDAGVQGAFYRALQGLVDEGRFRGGAGLLMDIQSGELIALVSVPEYDPNVLSAGKDKAAIAAYLNDSRLPFLNRAVSGLYTPGSIVKPYLALAALNEGVISPDKEIYSDGALRLPNPFAPGTFSIFRDWKAHGWVDVRRALAVSSNVYFYTIGGGFGDQAGLGIKLINKYASLFGFGQPTGLEVFAEEVGLVPSPEWKEKVFAGDPWRLGDTYHTSIGQYGFQVTPLQVVRAMAALASGGRLVTPTLLKTATGQGEVIPGIAPEWYQVVREGLRQGVLEGTAGGLNHPAVAVAAKTGTAELGVSKEDVNSWVTGFFPYEQPRYAFAVVLERGERGNLIGGVYAMRQVLDWLAAEAPEYLSVDAGAKNR
jgi:penicillin-binding protein 2